MRPCLLRIWTWLPIPEWARWLIVWLLTPKFMVGSVAVIFDAEGSVLLFRHTYHRAYPWGLPGGWMKPGEDAASAIEREVAEESGFRVKALYPLAIGGDLRYRRVDLILLCSYLDGEFRPSAEVAEARFVPVSELAGLIEPKHHTLVADAIGRLQGEPFRHPERSAARDPAASAGSLCQRQSHKWPQEETPQMTPSHE